MSTLQTARQRARAEVIAEIKDAARRQLAAEGASGLSLRAVARELGMVSSAIYRYFPSRDELLTALIVDGYDSIGAAAEQALHRSQDRPPATRWLAVCRSIRTWARKHPHEYALLYGSPVPGYRAPETTIDPASRAALALVAVIRTGAPLAADDAGIGDALRSDLERLATELDLRTTPAQTATVLVAWTRVFGIVSFELFGQFQNVVDATADFFDVSMAQIAADLGLPDR